MGKTGRKSKHWRVQGRMPVCLDSKSKKVKSILFKIIIIIWMLNIVISIFDSSLEIYKKIIIQFYNGLYTPFFTRVFRLILFIIGWTSIVFCSIKNRKKTFKGYNIILTLIIFISIFSVGVCLNYYRDFKNIKNNNYIETQISSSNIHTFDFYDRKYIPSIKTDSGDRLYISSNDYYSICCKMQIENLNNKISNSNSDNKIIIKYLKFTKTILKIEE